MMSSMLGGRSGFSRPQVLAVIHDPSEITAEFSPRTVKFLLPFHIASAKRGTSGACIQFLTRTCSGDM